MNAVGVRSAARQSRHAAAVEARYREDDRRSLTNTNSLHPSPTPPHFIRASENPRAAHRLCEIFSGVSREYLLTGQRFLALVQTDDPGFMLPPVGAHDVAWNPRERAPWTRGM